MNKRAHLSKLVFVLALLLTVSGRILSAAESENASETIEQEQVLMRLRPTETFVKMNSCPNIIQHAPHFVQGVNEADVGHLSEMVELLREAGVSKAGANYLMVLFDKALDKDSAVPALAQATKDIDRQLFSQREQQPTQLSARQNPLSICVGKAPCVLNRMNFSPDILDEEGNGSAEAGHVALPLNFKMGVVSSYNSYLRLKGEALEKFLREGLRVEEAIFLRALDPNGLEGSVVSLEADGRTPIAEMSGQGAVRVVSWASQLVRELAKHSLFTQLNEWVEANLRRIKNKQEVDNLFRMYVGFTDDGQIIISNEFYTILSYSRNTAAWAEAETRLTRYILGDSKDVQEFINKRTHIHQVMTLHEIDSAIGRSRRIEFGVSEKNALTRGDDYMARMQQTIAN